jgi:hypothetical protein
MAQRRGKSREREIDDIIGHRESKKYPNMEGRERGVVGDRLDRLDLLPDQATDPDSTDMLTEIMQVLQQLTGGEGALQRRPISEDAMQAAAPEDFEQDMVPRSRDLERYGPPRIIGNQPRPGEPGSRALPHTKKLKDIPRR